MKNKLVFYILFLLVVSFMRVLPHPVGCSPLIAASLFITMNSDKYKKHCFILLPLFFALTAQLQSGFWQGWWIQPVSLFIVLALNSNLSKVNFISTAALGFVASVQFFIASNTGAWLAHALPYPMTLGGWFECMNMGIPYFRPQLMWDVLFTTSIFMTYKFMIQPSKYFTAIYQPA